MLKVKCEILIGMGHKEKRSEWLSQIYEQLFF